MNDIEMMELSINEWEEISRNHAVSCDSMMEFLEEIIEKSETQATQSIRRMKHTCEHCRKEFTDKRNLKRHMKVHAANKEFHCSFCTRRFYRQDKKRLHEINCRRLQIPTENNRRDVFIGGGTDQVGGGLSSDIVETVENDGCESAINGNLKTIHVKPRVNEKYDLSLFLQGKRANVLKNLEKEFKEKRGLKWFITVQVRMVKYRPDGQDEFSTPHFRSNCQRLVNLNELSVQYQECVDKVRGSFQAYQREGSGWQLQEVSS